MNKIFPVTPLLEIYSHITLPQISNLSNNNIYTTINTSLRNNSIAGLTIPLLRTTATQHHYVYLGMKLFNGSPDRH